jgi:hypothetical protein
MKKFSTSRHLFLTSACSKALFRLGESGRSALASRRNEVRFEEDYIRPDGHTLLQRVAGRWKTVQWDAS